MHTRILNGTTKEPIIETLIQAMKRCGLGGLSPDEMDGLVAAIADKVEADLQLRPPIINPDREYSLTEIRENGFGPKQGRFYKAYKHIIRKDGRRSYVIGRDLLDLRNRAPTLATSPVPMPSAMRRPRGRPRKIAVADAQNVPAVEATASR